MEGRRSFLQKCLMALGFGGVGLVGGIAKDAPAATTAGTYSEFDPAKYVVRGRYLKDGYRDVLRKATLRVRHSGSCTVHEWIADSGWTMEITYFFDGLDSRSLNRPASAASTWTVKQSKP